MELYEHMAADLDEYGLLDGIVQEMAQMLPNVCQLACQRRISQEACDGFKRRLIGLATARWEARGVMQSLNVICFRCFRLPELLERQMRRAQQRCTYCWNRMYYAECPGHKPGFFGLFTRCRAPLHNPNETQTDPVQVEYSRFCSECGNDNTQLLKHARSGWPDPPPKPERYGSAEESQVGTRPQRPPDRPM